MKKQRKAKILRDGAGDPMNPPTLKERRETKKAWGWILLDELNARDNE